MLFRSLGEPAVLTRLAERLLEPGAGDEAGALAAVARLAVPAASSELAG